MSAKTTILAAILALSGSLAAQAQDFTGMDFTASYNAWALDQNRMMGEVQNTIVQSNVNDPRVMALYATCGAGLTPEQFALKYAATAGCTPEGYAAYNRTSNEIAARDKAALADYQNSVDNYRRAYDAYTGRFAEGLNEAGNVMVGRQTYADPASGSNVVLSYIPPGYTYSDPMSGRVYQMDGNGQYWSSAGDGQWVPVNPAGR